jgi:uncharacterized membrane protein HdeD (DUF308 family)
VRRLVDGVSMKARPKYYAALSIAARVVGALFAITGVIGVVAELYVPSHTGRAGAFAVSLFALLVGLGLMLAKPITAAGVENFFGRRR